MTAPCLKAYLAGDIGGTNTRLRLVERPNPALADNDSAGERVLAEATYPSGDFRHLTDIIHAFLDSNPNCRRPNVVALAVAGPIVNNTCKVTNVKRWDVLDGEKMATDLRVDTVLLLNDFAAIGYALLDLPPEDVEPLTLAGTRPHRVPGAPMACLGAGTGLGECYLTFNGSEYDVWPTEGGHTSFSPRNIEEMDLMHSTMRRNRLRTVSVERVCSGSALPDMYKYFCRRYPNQENPAVTRAIKNAGHEPGAVIGRRGMDGSDALCRRTVELFVSIYGAEAGNLALKILPTGGLYVAGGIAPKILPAMKENDAFMRSMVSKGRMRSVLEKIPVYVVKHKQIGLLGACVISRRLLRKGRAVVAPESDPIKSRL